MCNTSLSFIHVQLKIYVKTSYYIALL